MLNTPTKIHLCLCEEGNFAPYAVQRCLRFCLDHPNRVQRAAFQFDREGNGAIRPSLHLLHLLLAENILAVPNA
jgi:hypothetical protein